MVVNNNRLQKVPTIDQVLNAGNATNKVLTGDTNPLNLGTLATTSHSLTNSDVLIGGKLEVDGDLLVDSKINITADDTEALKVSTADGSTTYFSVDTVNGTVSTGSSPFFIGDMLYIQRTHGTGSTIADVVGTDRGSILYFNGRKGAFRAGFVDTDAWEDTNVGDKSVAIGSNTEASGESSTAVGFNITSSGFQASAVGNTLTAAGIRSTCVGNNVAVNSAATDAFGIGDAILISGGGDHSMVVGKYLNSQAEQSHLIGSGVDASNKMISTKAFSLGFGVNTTTPAMYLTDNDDLLIGTDTSLGDKLTISNTLSNFTHSVYLKSISPGFTSGEGGTGMISELIGNASDSSSYLYAYSAAYDNTAGGSPESTVAYLANATDEFGFTWSAFDYTVATLKSNLVISPLSILAANGYDTIIAGGSPSATEGPNGDGGDLYLYSGEGAGTGSDGDVLLGYDGSNVRGKVGIGKVPTVELDVNGDVIISGDLTINGTTTTIDTTTLLVEDKNIEIGNVDTPSDVTADGGGITLKGSTDKTIIWDNANDNWTSSENWNITTGKEYKINNVSVLSATTLGSAVVNSSLTSVGTLTGLTMGGDINLDSNNITNGGTITGSTITDGTATLTGGALSGVTDYSGGAVFNEAGADVDFRIESDTDTHALFVRGSDGNIGIGTDSPDELLDIDGNMEQNSLKRGASSESVADDGTITLPTGVSGWLKVMAGDNEEAMEVRVASDGTVTIDRQTTNCADTDSDTNLCVYDGGSGTIIKNRLGDTKTIKYVFDYS